MSVNFEPVSMVRCHSEWDDCVMQAARAALQRLAAEYPDFREVNSSADVIVEQLWNAIVTATGHDGAPTGDTP